MSSAGAEVVMGAPVRAGGWVVGCAGASGAPAGLRAADALRDDLLAVAAGPVGRHGVGGQAALLAPGGEPGSDVGGEGVHDDGVGGEHVVLALGELEGVTVEEQRARCHLLD